MRPYIDLLKAWAISFGMLAALFLSIVVGIYAGIFLLTFLPHSIAPLNLLLALAVMTGLPYFVGHRINKVAGWFTMNNF